MKAAEKKNAEMKARLVSFLKKIPLFSDLSSTSNRKILSVCSKITLNEGEILCKIGEESNSMFILLYGRLSILLQDAVPITFIDPVSSIGEMGVFTGEPRSATVMAVKDSGLLRLRKSDLNAFIRTEPRFGINIMSKVIEILADRIKTHNIRIKEFQNYIISEDEARHAKEIADEIIDDIQKEGGE